MTEFIKTLKKYWGITSDAKPGLKKDEPERFYGAECSLPPTLAKQLRERDTPVTYVPPGFDEKLYK